MGPMPFLLPPAIPDGRLAASDQPVVPVDGELLLRPWEAGDATVVVEAFQDPAIQLWHGRRADSEDEAREWITQWRAAWAAESGANWAVADARSGAVAGRLSLRALDLGTGQAELAYWTHPAARGRGVAQRAVAAVTAWAFAEAGFHRLELMHSVANHASCRVATKSGFALEGTRRSALLHADGWHDMHLHARLRDDT